MARVIRRLAYTKSVRSTRRMTRDVDGQPEQYDNPCDLRDAIDAIAATHNGHAIPGDAQASPKTGTFGRCYSFPDDAAADAFLTNARRLHASVAAANRIP